MPTPTIPTIIRRKSMITLPIKPPVTFPMIKPTYDPHVKNLTHQLITLWQNYKGKHSHAKKYKAIIEEALDKVLLL
jgi:hypothetical protein